MSAKTTKEICHKFFRNRRPSVLEIDGAWGSGKTHLWQTNLINDAIDSKSFCGCAYGSLFGVATIDELKATILIGYQPTSRHEQETKLQRYRRKAAAWAQNNSSTINKIVRYIPEGVQKWAPKEVIKDVVAIGSHLAFSSRIDRSLICLDDIERTDWNLITPESLLGFINWLETDRNCSVVLIVNEAELGKGREAYNRFHEKIVDVRAKFQPTPDELFPIVFEETYPRRDDIAHYISILKISNIRLYSRLRFLFDSFFARFRHLPPALQISVIASVVLFCWAIYGSPNPKIEISYLKSRKLYRSSSDRNDTPDAVAVEALLTRYGFGAFDEIDECLVPFVRDGHLEGTNIEAVLDQAVEKFARSNSQEAFFNAWRIFHDSFDENENVFATKLVDTTISASRDGLSLSNLNSAVKILRDLGRDADADKVIEMYIQANAENREALDLTHPFALEVTDSKLRAAVQKQAASLAHAITLHEAAQIIVTNGDRLADARMALAAASVDEIAAILKMDWGRNLHPLCAELLAPTTNPAYANLSPKTMEALTKIGATSLLNRLRISRYINTGEAN